MAAGQSTIQFSIRQHELRVAAFAGRGPTVTLGHGAPEELLRRLHDAGWDVVSRRDESTLLYHPWAVTVTEARELLAGQGFDVTKFCYRA